MCILATDRKETKDIMNEIEDKIISILDKSIIEKKELKKLLKLIQNARGKMGV